VAIKVVNCKHFKGLAVYIGRPSIFGNPFPINRFNDRSAVIKKYRKWLWTELQKDGKLKAEFIKLANLASKENLNLSCWCKQPNREVACHGDVLKAAIEWYIRSNMSLNSIDIFSNDDTSESRLVTGIQQLDTKLGFLQSGLVTLKGKAGHGKTALALFISQECKQSSLYLSAEMAEAALALRLVARKAKLKLTDIVNKSIPKEDIEAGWQYTKENTPFLHTLDAVHGFVSIDLIRDEVKKIKQQDGASTVFVVIDSVNDWLVKSLGSYDGLTKDDIAKKLAIELNDVAKEDGFVVLAILQAGRDKNLESAFEYAAETVLSINLERDGREDKQGIKKACIKLLKNRVGDTATIMLDFQGNFQNFLE
jgi:replicative DNA helicase